MTDNLLDIRKWKREYPFLDTVWDTYNEFDKSVDGDKNKYMYQAFCNPLMEKLGENEEEHKNFCLKLVRNLGRYSLGAHPYFNPNCDRCKILYYWIYNSLRKEKISNTIITECFDDYNTFMRKIDKTSRCSYHSYYDNYKEPMNIIILDIFQSNMDIVKDIVAINNDKINFDLQKYICECVKIYKEMDGKYCPNKDDDDHVKISTCNALNTFKTIYKLYLSEKPHNNYKIPSLDDVEKEYTKKCLLDKLELPSTAPIYTGVHELQASTEDIDERKGELSSPPPLIGQNPGSSMSRTVSTAVGTMAGASSILALLYKFTPGRRWIHSGFGRKNGRIDNNLYAEGPNELLFQGFESEDMSSYNARYNIGYGSA